MRETSIPAAGLRLRYDPEKKKTPIGRDAGASEPWRREERNDRELSLSVWLCAAAAKLAGHDGPNPHGFLRRNPGLPRYTYDPRIRG
jgi:hypothetical protein